MRFLSLLEVSSMPNLQLLIICFLGAFLATDYVDLLGADARRSLNKIVFSVFTPSLLFSNLAKSVRFRYIISWWFMPVNIAITFLVGGSLGWIAMKIVRPKQYIQNVVIAMCAAGNLGNILLIVIPAICKEAGSPFGDKNACTTTGLSYVSFSMALGAFFIWTYAYNMIRRAKDHYNAMLLEAAAVEGNEKTIPLIQEVSVDVASTSADYKQKKSINFWRHILEMVKGVVNQIVKELVSPPILGAILGFIFGTIPWLRNAIVGDAAPLRVIDSCIKLLGDGTIPCITLIIGGNLINGIKKAEVNLGTVLSIIVVRYVIQPVVGIVVVSAASKLGVLPSDPLFSFILMLQYTLPPANNISTMTQLYGVAEAECAVLIMWSYVVAAFAMTAWSTVFMSILT